MNQQARKSLEKILLRMERQSRSRHRRVSTAPLVLAAGLVLADVLLAQLVPMIWESLLPLGPEQAEGLGGWPGLIWHAAVYCRFHQGAVQVGIGVVTLLSVLACGWARPLRPVVWLSAAAVIALNALILIVTIQTSLRTTASAAGIDLG